MVEWITGLMSSLGYVGIALLMFLEKSLSAHPFRVDHAAGRLYRLQR